MKVKKHMKNILKITIIIGFMFVLSSCWGDKTKPNFKNGMTSQCKDIFIGNVYQFKNNDLFLASILENNNSDYYIEIFFNEDYDKDNLDLKYIDSDDSISQEINKNIANRAFNLKGLDTIYLYSKLNDLIGYGTYKKSEYYQNHKHNAYIPLL